MKNDHIALARITKQEPEKIDGTYGDRAFSKMESILKQLIDEEESFIECVCTYSTAFRNVTGALARHAISQEARDEFVRHYTQLKQIMKDLEERIYAAKTANG